MNAGQGQKYLSKPFYVGTYVLLLLLFIPCSVIPVVAGQGRIKDEYLPLTFLGMLPALAEFALVLVLLYKIWSVVPPRFARTTPGKAIGFMFIPLFNLFWNFQAIYGWVEDFNCYAKIEKIPAPRVSGGAAMAYCAVNVVSSIIGVIASLAGYPIVGIVLGAPTWILMPVFIFQACSAVNALPPETVRATLSARAALLRAIPGGPATPAALITPAGQVAPIAAAAPAGQFTPATPAGSTGQTAPDAPANSAGLTTLLGSNSQAAQPIIGQPAKGLGIASLVLGILSIILPYLGFILGIIGIVLARKQRKRFKEGISLAGLITSIVGTSLWGLVFLAIVIVVIIVSSQ